MDLVKRTRGAVLVLDYPCGYICRAMKVGLSFAVLVVLLAQFAAADSKREAAEGLLRRAAETSGPSAVVKGPYRIEYKLTFHGPSGPIEGTYSSAWISRNRWRREVSVPGFSDTEVSDGASRWIARKPHLSEPHIVGELLADLGFVADGRLSPIEKVSKIREDVHGGARLECIEIARPDELRSLGEKSLCFDEGSSALVRITDGGRRTEFSEFDNRGGALIAKKVQQFHGHDLIAEAELTSLGPQAPAATGLLDHAADSRRFDNCDGDIGEGRLVDRTNPVYPPAARMARKTGTVEIYAVIDTDGTLKDMEIVRSASKLLDDAALEAIRKWRYRPYMCGGNPVQVETTVSVSFSL
jgi:TonB family protein